MANKICIGRGDVLIPVLGPTGAGKSCFINTVLNYPNLMPEGGDLNSCTTKLAFGCIESIQNYPRLKNRRIVLIDTPGFDNTEFMDDSEILYNIATQLKEFRNNQAEIAGIIYLHDITQERFGATARQNLNSLRDLCKDDGLKNVVLVTTKWSRKTAHSETHQQQLESKHWKSLIDKGAKVCRFDRGHESAWAVIDTIICAWEEGSFQPSTNINVKPVGPRTNRIIGFFSSKRWWAF